MADTGSTGFGDLFALLGANNPISAVTKNIETFRQGVEGFVAAVQTFNTTMETLNIVAQRVSSLLDEVEGPVRVLMPQVTKATLAAQSMIDQLSAPIDKVAPGLERLGQTLMSPSFDVLPTTLNDFLEVVSDLSKRLRPLGQLAEAAGGMLGLKNFTGFRLPGMSGAAMPAPPPPPAPTPARRTVAKPAAKKAPEKRSAAGAKPGAKQSATAQSATPKKK